MASAELIYETPLNEYMRICLRLESLGNLFNATIHNDDTIATHVCLRTLLQTREVINRPDIKSKLTQALTQIATTLGQLEQFKEINTPKLKQTLQELDECIGYLQKMHLRFGEPLRQNEFLNILRLHLNDPGGLCNHISPALNFWFHQSNAARQQQLKHWFKDFTPLIHIANLILRLTRESSEPQKISSPDGFYQQNLNPNLPCQLLRIGVEPEQIYYPEVSVGKHRVAINFFVANFESDRRAEPYNGYINFKLYCCRI